MSEEKKPCACASAPKLIFSCSGAADVGELCDHAARALTREGVGKMYCLAGVGGGVEGILANTRAAAKIVALDGCALDCARNTLEKAGMENVAHLRISDAGFAKGASPATEENLNRLLELARPLLEC
ncbi:MAG: putative zinc-binding protein [Candidatus Hydrogenedentes bacterium]|nr:putative zinc-binding protein [Candidatus Hydrogenedentota bacterium]